MITTDRMTDQTPDKIPEVDSRELQELLADLPDDVMLEILMDAGLIDTGEADG